ncbi:M28 family peptidase, partial [Candidatus Sumerlaeota bacterium]|nr:M28 family peptidase [Candidatus Sumerlaeota bacterium]
RESEGRYTRESPFSRGGMGRILLVYDEHLDRENLRRWMQRISSRPHHVGSPFGKSTAEFIAEKFESWGYETEIEVFHVLFPTPKTRLLEMIEPTAFRAALAEPTLPEDATSAQHDEQLPSYNAYSVDGDVTGELVYVHYGVPEDYETLKEHGVDVKGKIVIARYGGSWRGIKPKVAAENGAIACIIYSDPRDDGFYQGDVYPEGAYRNETGVQRGSVMDMPLFPGDPLTPGRGATENAERLEIDEAPTLTKIPVLPISHADAIPLLEAMEGPVAPAGWRGSLPITYHLGPGPAKVHLKLEFDWQIVPAYNVIAKMAGAQRPDQWIIRGNHHDAWVNGARDPVSGLVPMMEEARAIGELARSGWRPKRTIVFCAWDAEEPGLIGSTEWAEHHGEELKNKAVAYINTDSNGRGFLRIAGSHTLEKFINQVARDVIDPQKGVSVHERWRARRIVQQQGKERSETLKRRDLRIAALGSGSDYTPFLQHLGIASLNIGYSGESGGGSYHSIYDSYDHYVRFSDPDFAYGIALAQTCGRAVLRLAEADVVPIEFMNFTDTIKGYIEEVIELADDMRKETEEENQMIEDSLFDLQADPEKTYVAPDPEEAVPHLNFAPLENALSKLTQSAKDYAEATQGLEDSESGLSEEDAKELDAILFKTERALTRAEGLPRRSWYKHAIYAPGFYTGYGVKTLPGVREAIEERRWDEAEEHIVFVAEVLERLADEIDRASAKIAEAIDGPDA